MRVWVGGCVYVSVGEGVWACVRACVRACSSLCLLLPDVLQIAASFFPFAIQASPAEAKALRCLVSGLRDRAEKDGQSCQFMGTISASLAKATVDRVIAQA